MNNIYEPLVEQFMRAFSQKIYPFINDVTTRAFELRITLIEEEEKETIKEFMWTEFGKELLRKSVHGLPEFYKLHLLKKLDNQ